jgi:hypothetical protein
MQDELAQLIDEQGALLFVGVERDIDKNIKQHQAKWCNS